ncbi:hypothetical protein KR51_00016110 [Rubidibacter lacunae KORDI 51-2]|uniref:Uncharacterized protein n=1 Tax=Rubidibacter lacunae KORDI 51-2 TaxID=582515 RepID=U5DLK4_9CHRO|nr:hypothetical protein [Rubidibacter lacunae]ERN41762.1 hypothetical protein KR51_00016110 [Rubidibacter lacunae KORDI 51-2]
MQPQPTDPTTEIATASDAELPVLVDPMTLHLARELYQQCYDIYPARAESSRGVAVRQDTHRAHIILSSKPVLLPWERFVPSHQLRVGWEINDIPAAASSDDIDLLIDGIVDAWDDPED